MCLCAVPPAEMCWWILIHAQFNVPIVMDLTMTHAQLYAHTHMFITRLVLGAWCAQEAIYNEVLAAHANSRLPSLAVGAAAV